MSEGPPAPRRTGSWVPALRVTPLRTLGVATTGSTLGALPVWLTGALAVYIAAELGFSETQHGAAVSVYFAAASLASLLAGVVTERIGARRAVVGAIMLALIALFGVAVLATRWWHLLPFMIIAGTGSAVMQPATNLALARGIPPERQAVSFGLKQASIPFATLVAGAAVPLLGATLGWRAAFLVAGVGMLLFLLIVPVLPTDRRAKGSGRRPWSDLRPSLLVVTAGAGLGVAAATAMGAFAVLAGVARGLAPGPAGTALAVASLSAAVTRVGVGWLADRRTTGHLLRVTWMMLLGAIAAVVLALSSQPWIFLAAMAVLFSAGWGWNGLFIYAVVRRYPQAPAVATGVTQVGLRAGGVLGPIGFGVLASGGSDVPAWLAVGASLGAGCLLMWLGRVMMRRERRADEAAGAAPGSRGSR